MNIKNLLTFAIVFSTVLNSETLSEPTSYSKDLYSEKILSGTYTDSIDHPNEFLDFNYGDRVANPSQISNAVLKWSEQSNKIKVVEYAKSHENRPLYALFISSPKNINNLDQIKELISSPGETNVTLKIHNNDKAHQYKLNEKRKIDQKTISQLRNVGVTLKIN